MENISKAIIKVMQKVRGIEKSMTVGEGRNSYKGMSDADVKEKISEAMADCGLCIITTSIEPKVTIERWDGLDYKGSPTIKQQVFTEVTTKYLLLHESGESIELSGYGHGVDTQDKSAGKATTYALKNTLLYTFLVATKKIDDTDTVHSDDHEVPAKPINTKATVDSSIRLVKGRKAYREFLMDNTHVFSQSDITAFQDYPSWTVEDFEREYKRLKKLKTEREEALQMEAAENGN